MDTLYCSEQHCEEEQQYELQDYYYCNNTTTITNFNNIPSSFLQKDMSWNNEELKSLLAKQQENSICIFLETNSVLESDRRESIEWMMKVKVYYSFSALTAVLAVNYLDRFLFSFRFQNEKPWMTHLAAVASLSLAAKMEETQVPLLLDLQVEDSRFLFEAKTIQKMEILVLSTLGWKMNPATPLSFIDFIIRRLGLKDRLCWEFLKRCESVLLSIIRSDFRFLSYLPSVLATAIMIHVFNSVEPNLGDEYQIQLLGILGINKEKVDECGKLMLKMWTGYEEGKQCKKRKFVSIPSSPNGVMDVSFSSDNWNDSWTIAAATTANSVSSSPEPLSKKIRTQDQLLINSSTNSDFLTIPH
ncbi:cyclin-D3-2-like [Cicer arietinum]|uniref:B-like cyclin n=1 Tax=Cicer arietinum TaxID=3827 RepID=A0A1S2YB82_CICAR|nr:cyclin-D3-2-like [Cicer arietinum]